MKVQQSVFGVMADGRIVNRYRLSNSTGAHVDIINLGAIITEMHFPDRDGHYADIVLGFDNPKQYMLESPYFGAVVGRYANRIKGGRFSLGNQSYELATNNGPNALHGGAKGFDKKLWNVSSFEGDDHAGIKLDLISEDGEEGYPGRVEINVTYTFDDSNRLTVDYSATTDKDTVINLTQHTYFNLDGHASGSITDHELSINASHYTPVDKMLIPTGDIMPVADTPMDFQKSKSIGQDIGTNDEQLEYAGGYDHNWVINKTTTGSEYELAVSVYAPQSGRTLKVYTDQPGIQFYSGNFLDSSITGKNGTVYHHRQGFCLETQHFPDSPNRPDFPSTVLRTGEKYTTRTVFEFGR